MKKSLPYILASVLAIALILLLGSMMKFRARRFDPRITFRRQDKIPYGCYVAYRNLKSIFPNASIYTNHHEPGYWDSLSNFGTHQAFIMMAGALNADEEEMKSMISFVEKGNEVFISANDLSEPAQHLLGCESSLIAPMIIFDNKQFVPDTLRVSLISPPFREESMYSYPGDKMSAWFHKYDTTTTEVLGKDELQRPNFIHLRAGKGNLFVQLVPIAFSNFFLLHANNIGYYEKSLSVVSSSVTRVVWDEYYLNKRGYTDEGRHNWFNVLMRIPAMKAALLIAIFTLLVYILLEMRRKQRYIPIMSKPRNDSLDFVKTIGRLYYDKGDHRNLAKKMSAYFLDHVRTKYKMATSNMNEEFIRNLQYKSGHEEAGIRTIVNSMKYIDESATIDARQLAEFHKQLDAFYHKT